MSGVSTGSVFYKPIVAMLAVSNAAENIISASAKCLFAGALAVHKHYKAQEEKAIRETSREADKLTMTVINNISLQSGKFEAAVENMINNITASHKLFAESLSNFNSEDFSDKLKNTENQTLKYIKSVNDNFKKNYTELINVSNAQITAELNKLRKNIFEELSEIEADNQDKKERALKRAEELVSKAKNLQETSKIYTAAPLIAQAEKDIATENFQSAMSLAVSAVTDIYMNMYKSDSEEKEKTYYQNCCIFLSSEIKEFLNNLKSVKFKKNSDSETFMQVDLSRFMNGQFESFMSETENSLETVTGKYEQLNTLDLIALSEKLSRLYTEINEAAVEAFYLMSYTFSRVEIEKEIHNILLGKGFVLTETRFEDGNPVKSGERTYRCGLTGEELKISFISHGDISDIQSELIIKSDNSNEDSRQQYRNDITSRINKNCRNITDLKLNCKESTKNQNASDIQISEYSIPNLKEIKK